MNEPRAVCTLPLVQGLGILFCTGKFSRQSGRGQDPADPACEPLSLARDVRRKGIRTPMDSITHLHFAYRLLSMTGGDPSAAVCSLFPQIDREPAYFHRMYGHPFFQARLVTDIGLRLYGTNATGEGECDPYVARRFVADRLRMAEFFQSFQEDMGFSCQQFRPDRLSAVMAFCSHTYQDVFNNPMQAFLPLSVFPCGKWELWQDLGPVQFRRVLYHPDNISRLREEVFGSRLWDRRLNPGALVHAMIRRTAEFSVARLNDGIIDEAVDSLQLDVTYDSSDLAAAEQFLKEHEDALEAAIRKYSRVNGEVDAALPQPVPS